MSQQCIITIGPYSILLPDDKGAPAAVKTLSRGLLGYHYRGDSEFTVSDTCTPGFSYPGKVTIKKSDRITPEAEEALTPQIRRLGSAQSGLGLPAPRRR